MTKIKIDLHNHSEFSPDGGAKYEQIIDAAIKNGVRYLGITDHDYQPTIEDMIKVDNYAKGKGIEVFLGVENSMSKGVHIQSFYPQMAGDESEDVKQYLTDRKNVLEGIYQSGIIMHENYKKLGYEVTLDDCKNIAGRKSYQTLFFFTALGEKFPELFPNQDETDTIFKANRNGAMKKNDGEFDGINPETLFYSQTTCDLDKESSEFHENLKNRYGLTIPQGTSDRNPEDVIYFVNKYAGVSIIAHPGLIEKNIFDENIGNWIDSGLDAISCEGYPYDKISDIKKGWKEAGYDVDSFNNHLKDEYVRAHDLKTSGGTDSHQSTKDYESFNKLLAGQRAIEIEEDYLENTIVPRLIDAKKAFYEKYL